MLFWTPSWGLDFFPLPLTCFPWSAGWPCRCSLIEHTRLWRRVFPVVLGVEENILVFLASFRCSCPHLGTEERRASRYRATHLGCERNGLVVVRVVVLL